MLVKYVKIQKFLGMSLKNNTFPFLIGYKQRSPASSIDRRLPIEGGSLQNSKEHDLLPTNSIDWAFRKNLILSFRHSLASCNKIIVQELLTMQKTFKLFYIF